MKGIDIMPIKKAMKKEDMNMKTNTDVGGFDDITKEDLLRQILELKAQLMNNNNNQEQNVAYITSKMDKPCTIIHLLDCPAGLQTTLLVDGKTYTFTKFGEKKTLRFSIMEQLCSKYREYFDRGVFMLGNDCGDVYEEFGIEPDKMPMSVSQYKKMASLPDDEFEKLLTNMNDKHRIQITHEWVTRYYSGDDSYGNIQKINILNKLANGALGNFLEDVMRGRR